jgi:hypothetical protein
LADCSFDPTAGTLESFEEGIRVASSIAAAGRWLTMADRCDRCGAAGYVLAVFPTGDLVFCAHHGRKYLPRLASTAILVQDETDRLLAE